MLDTNETKLGKDSRKRRKKKRKPKKPGDKPPVAMGVAPWIVTLFIAAAAGIGGYYMYEKNRMTNESLKEAKAQASALQKQLQETEDNRLALAGERTKLKEKLETARNELKRTSNKLETTEETLEKNAAKADELEKKLQGVLKKSEGKLVKRDGRLTLELVDKVLFNSGKSELTPQGVKVLEKVGKAVKDLLDKQIWVQGHTDNLPIAKTNDKFDSNWELASARALSVVHFLQDDVGISGKRLAAVSFSKFRPVSRWRAKNRRIEIVLFPRKVKLARK